MEKFIPRPNYLDQLKSWSSHHDLIKIVTGVRRSGKSYLLKLFFQYLLDNGVLPKQICKIELDIDDNEQYLDRKVLYQHILKNLVPDKMNYVLLDEIQLVKDWQKTVNSLRSKENIDLYLTGSNAYMFSGELATLLGGRYVEINLWPLSFKEYFTVKPDANLDDSYQRYINEGGFPRTLYLNDVNQIKNYLMNAVYMNTIRKDIILRFNITHTSQLDDVIRFLFDNIGNLVSLRKIMNGLASSGRKVSIATIDMYIKGLCDGYLLHRCMSYDIKGKKILNSNFKYYICDTGLRAMILGRENADLGRILENIVYLELLRRGFEVNIGRIGRKLIDNKMQIVEVDFVAQKPNGIIEYYQVALTVLEENTFKREIRSLEAIKDNYPKYLLTMDAGFTMHKGIKRINVINWLLER